MVASVQQRPYRRSLEYSIQDALRVLARIDRALHSLRLGRVPDLDGIGLDEVEWVDRDGNELEHVVLDNDDLRRFLDQLRSVMVSEIRALRAAWRAEYSTAGA